jgi:hypothetical protein
MITTNSPLLKEKECVLGIKYEWPNKLSFEDRLWIVRYYLEGYGLFHIATVYGVTTSTIEYHLKKANVFTPYKKPTLYGNVNPIPKRVIVIQRTLANIAPIDNNKYYYDDLGERYRRPKTYKQIVNEYNRIQRLKRAQQGIQPQQEESKGFLIRVSLTTGHVEYSGIESTISW